MGSSVFPEQNFNPLPRKEGDAEAAFSALPSESISIHSLVKRETPFWSCLANVRTISIHSLVKRETQDYLKSVAIVLYISIHSLVKRETKVSQSCFMK